MFIIFPTGRRYTVTVTRAATKLVVCEKCNHTYEYNINATASSSKFSLFYLNNKGAEISAKDNAEKNLNDIISTTVLPIPCPACKHYQFDMIEPYRSLQYPRLSWFYKKWTLFWLLGLLFTLFFVIPLSGKVPFFKILIPFTFVACPFFSTFIWIYIKYARKKINPN